MRSVSQHLKRFRGNQDGATAIEAAVVFPLLMICLFGVVGMGSFMYGGHQAQRTVEETARQARVINSPTQTQLETLMIQNVKPALFGTYEPSVRLITQFDGDYAELMITYNFKFDLPILDNLQLKSNASTQVKLREMPT